MHEPEYETIDESELLDTDDVVEHIHEEQDGRAREENGEEGRSSRQKKVKIVKRPVSISDIHPLWTKTSERVYQRRIH